MKQTPEQIAVDSFGGSKEAHPFFSTITNEAYIGYCTAMLLRENPKSGLSAKEWFQIVTKLVSDKQL